MKIDYYVNWLTLLWLKNIQATAGSSAMAVRAGEQEKTWFRSDRIFWSGDGWYFLTREQTQEGPFESRLAADQELNYYIRRAVEWSLYRQA